MSNPFDHDKRRNMTPQRIARVFAERGGRCGIYNQADETWGDGCGWRFTAGKTNYEVDHIIALAKGGVDDDRNLQLLCDACHSKKTSDDLGSVGHIRRSYTKHVVSSKKLRSRSWRT